MTAWSCLVRSARLLLLAATIAAATIGASVPAVADDEPVADPPPTTVVDPPVDDATGRDDQGSTSPDDEEEPTVPPVADDPSVVVPIPPGLEPDLDDPDVVDDGTDEPAEPVLLPDPVPGLAAARHHAIVTTAAHEAVIAWGQAAARRADAAATYRLAQTRVTEAEQALADSAAFVEDFAVRAFMQANATNAAPDTGDPDAALTSMQAATLNGVVADLGMSELAAARTHLFFMELFAEVAAGDLADADRAARAALDDLHQARAAVAALPPEPAAPPILTDPVLTAEQLAAWYLATYSSDAPIAPVIEIADLYITIGVEEGVAGDIAFAMSVLETGGFRSGHAAHWNFAGIGAYDRCAPVCGWVFPSLEEGVRAHIHLLRAYADPTLTVDDLAHPPDSRVAPGNVGVQGCCPTWADLTGVWATDINYHRKVLGLYWQMLLHARR